MAQSPNTPGFTLIELIVVVAVVGLLAAIAVPALYRQQQRSRRAEVQTNLKAFITAEKAYKAEKDEYEAALQKVGFQPERGNRYAYHAFENIEYIGRSTAATDAPCPTCNAYAVDTFKWSSEVAKPGTGVLTPGYDGAPDCEKHCAIIGEARGNLDSDATFDEWGVFTGLGATLVDAFEYDNRRLIAGEPFVVVDDTGD